MELLRCVYYNLYCIIKIMFFMLMEIYNLFNIPRFMIFDVIGDHYTGYKYRNEQVPLKLKIMANIYFFNFAYWCVALCFAGAMGFMIFRFRVEISSGLGTGLDFIVAQARKLVSLIG